jgi:two-component system, OmpR family, aerobic respiration control sensor histidine kinase ArcB
MISVFSQAKEIAFDALFNLLPINFSWVDTRGYILGCNQRLLDCLKIEEMGDILGRHMKDFVPDVIWENTKSVIEKGEDIIFEEMYKDKNDNNGYFLSIKSPVKSKEGKVLGIVIISIDITDRKLMEIELEQSKVAVQLADKAKTEFLRNMRHDLRTPFCGIIGNAELLESKEKDAGKKQQLRDIIESSESLLNHLNEILDYVKTESGEMPVTEKEFDIHSVLEDVYQMMLPSAKHKKLDFKFLVDKNIPRFLIGDIMRTQRILMNIITNSIKFTEKGYIHVSVGWSEKSDQKCVVQFIIEDTGIGIPPDKKEAIFEKFFRLTPSYNGTYTGSGLGLNIVKQFLDEVEGQYDIQSELGKGTTFKISIPYKVPLLDNILHGYINRTICKELAS